MPGEGPIPPPARASDPNRAIEKEPQLRVRIHFSGYVDVTIPDGLGEDERDEAIGEAWAAIPTPEDTTAEEFRAVDDMGIEREEL